MKILSVKIENLASISEAKIDFNGDILKNHAVFAITGKTGVGKSTILDAICLGIYGKTPRYDKIGGIELEDKMKGNNPSNILRRGCGKGSATVNFYGIGRIEYQAVWKVQRARGNANGTMQDATHELYAILDNGERKSIAQKSLVKDKVIEVTGLSFEQFRHAVLLPQGEFKAFLEAKADERASLLEKLTGTAIYGEISKIAHSRCSDKESAIKVLRAQIANISLLSDQEIIELKEQIHFIQEDLSTLNQRKVILEKTADWYRQNQKNQLELQAKQTELELVLEKLANQTAQITELQQYEKAVTSIQQPWRDLNKDQTALNQQATQLEKIKADQEIITKDLSTALQIQSETTVNLSIQEEAEQKLQPQIIQARELDTRIISAQKNQEQQQKTVAETAQNLDKLNQELANIHTDLTALLAKNKAIEISIEQLADYHPLFQERQLIRDNLNSLAKFRQSELTKQQQQIKFNSEKDILSQKLLKLQENFKQLTASQQTENQHISQIDSELTEFDLNLINQAIVENNGALFQIKNMQNLKLELIQTEQQLAKNQQDKFKSEQLLESQKNQEKAVEIVIGHLQISIEQQKENFNSASLAATKTAADLRSQLKNSEPCPVCGSLEHPYQETGLPHFDHFLTGLKSQILTAENDLKKQTELLKSLQTQNSKINSETSVFHANILHAEEKIQSLILQIGDFKQIDDLELLQSELTAKLLSDQQKQQKISNLQKKQAEIRQIMQKNNLELNALQQQITTETAKSSQLSADLQVIINEILHAQTEIGSLSNSLAAKFELISELKDIWHTNLSATGIKIEEQYQLLTGLQQQHENLNSQIQNLSDRQNHLSGQQLPITEQLALYQTSLDNQKLELNNLLQNRQKLFDGQSADAVAAKMSSATSQARLAKERASQKYQDLVQKENKLSTEIKLLSAQITQLEQTIALNKSAIDHYLAKENQTVKWLEILFNRSGDYYEKIRQSLKDLNEQRQNISGALAVLQKSVVEHLEQKPKIDLAECEQLPEIATALTEKAQAETALQAQLINDTNQRTGLQNQLTKIADAEAEIQVWREINDSIGSSDGKRFREYAQGINLSILLTNANYFLEQLRDRYELRRHQNSMEIVLVDKDLCNAVRPVNSLSGGESFLVSMALALGLSNMASGKIAINSLFIDEGFGTLDDEALSIVLQVLQSLHEMGKQVGIISHVPDIAAQIGAEIHLERAGGVASVEIRN